MSTLGVSLPSPPSGLLAVSSITPLSLHWLDADLTGHFFFLVSPDLLMAFDSVEHSSPLASLLAASWSSSYFRGGCYVASMLVSPTLAIPQMWCLPGQCPGPSLPTCCSGGWGFIILQLQCPFAGSPHILRPAEMLLLMSRAVIPADP